MNFGENLQFLRKRANMTQEELAEQLDVSRQTVSKWEAGTLPEMDRLLQLCDIFNCDLDALVRGDVAAAVKIGDDSYDKHMNAFALQIALGVGLALIGLTVTTLLIAIGVSEAIAGTSYLVFVAAAAILFIFGGLQHGNFKKKNPCIQPCYSESQIDKFNRRFPLCIAIPVAAILLGAAAVALLSTMEPAFGFSRESFDTLAAAFFLFIIAASVFTIVYSAILKSKYNNAADYSRENNPKKEETFADKISGCIMILATIVFLLLGFIGNLWHPGWIVFPIGGMVCAIVDKMSKKTEI